jgi:hypothetical protein
MSNNTLIPVVDSGSTQTMNGNAILQYVFAQDITVAGNINPTINNFYSLGTQQKKWANVYIGPGSLYLTDTINGATSALTSSNNILYLAGVSGLTAGNLQLINNNLVSLLPGTDIGIGLTTSYANINLNRKTIVYSPANLLVSDAAFNIVGSSSGKQQARTFSGTMLQITGQDNQIARVSLDSYGTTNQAYPLIAGRASRGNVIAPTNLQAGDNLMRIAGAGYANTQYNTFIAYVNLEATQQFTNNNSGTRFAIYNTANGQVAANLNAWIDSTGLVLTPNTSVRLSPKVYSANANISIDFTKDSIVYSSIGGNALSINPVNFVAGKTIDVWITQDGNTNWTLTHGLTARSSTLGATTQQLKVSGPGSTPLQVVHCKYTCIDGTSANTFVSITYQ